MKRFAGEIIGDDAAQDDRLEDEERKERERAFRLRRWKAVDREVEWDIEEGDR